MSDTFVQRLQAAHARIQYGNDERAAGADDRARAIAEEVRRRGRGGARQVAHELGVSETVISQAVSRARTASDPGQTLPGDTLDRLLAAELPTVPPLPAVQWKTLAWLIRGTVIDVTWIEQPGQLLAEEIEDADLDEASQPARIATVCRGLSRAQALAVIDTCQRGDLAALPLITP
jgi:DNA-binding transcriptional regulator YdaS (Cro superfamily)